jgi:hypothetical protein
MKEGSTQTSMRLEVAPWRAKRDRNRLKRQEQRWASKSGPVRTFIDPERMK